VLDPPPAQQPADAAGARDASAGPARAPSPLDLDDVLARQAIRRARLRAH
jgi:hypothetical protein